MLFLYPDWHHPVIGVTIFIVGCCLGSFFNVCIYRIPLGVSIVAPRSRCAACGVPLKAYENLPLIGWIARRGWCGCGLTRIDLRYLIVELISGLLFLALWFVFSPPLFFVYGLFLGSLLIVSLIDIDYFIIPDRFSIGGIVVGVLLSAFFPILHQAAFVWPSVQSSLLGACVGGLVLLAIAWMGRFLFKKEAMGLGDVKLLAAMGAFLGWQATLFTIAASSVIGSIVGLLVLCKGSAANGTRLPFGPFLSMAAGLWVFGGSRFLDWYLHLLAAPR